MNLAQQNRVPGFIDSDNQVFHSSCKALRTASRIEYGNVLPSRPAGGVRRLEPNFGSKVFRLVEIDSAKGYPGEGPAGRRAKSAPSRPPLDESASYHATTTVEGRRKAQGLLRDWLSDRGSFPLESLVENLNDLNRTLAGWIQHCYDSEIALGVAVDSLLSIHDDFYLVSKSLMLPWKRITAWQRGCPPELRAAFPPYVARRTVCRSQ